MSEVEALDVRVGTIREVSDVEGADELVRLRVDFGDHERTIVAGVPCLTVPERPVPEGARAG